MTLTTTKQIDDNLRQQATKPIYLVTHEFSGTPVDVSASGSNVLYDGTLFEAGLIKVDKIVDSRTAVLSVPANPTNIGYVSSGAWRNGTCQIYHVPTLPIDADNEYNADEGVLLLDGQIVSAQFSGKFVKFSVAHKNNLTKLSPRYTWDDLSVHVPPPNEELVWEGDRYILVTRDHKSNGVEERTITAVGGRVSARRLKGLSTPPDITLTTTGSGVPIEVPYGERTVGGKIIARGFTGGGDLVLAVGWCLGEVGIDSIFISEAAVPGGVTVTTYTGNPNQPVDPTLAANIAAFNTNFVLETENGPIAPAYSVFQIPTGQLDKAPTFQAIVTGKCIEDPRYDPAVEDATYSDWACAFDFSDPTDLGPNGLTYSIYGSADVPSGGDYAEFDGSADCAIVIEDDASEEIGASTPFEITVRFKSDDYANGSEQVICASAATGSSDYGWDIHVTAAGSLRFRMSSTGTQGNLIDAEIADISATDGTEHTLVIRRGEILSVYIVTASLNNGPAAILDLNENSAVYDASLGISLGAFSDGTYSASEFTGSVRSFRLVVGSYHLSMLQNYGAAFYDGLPFPEYKIPRSNSALCMGDFIQSPLYGLGGDVTNLVACADYNDELLESSFYRCRLSLSIAETRQAATYADLLGEYAECFWYNDGSSIKMLPNKIVGVDEASGVQEITNGTFDTDSDWTKGTGWTISGGSASCDGTQVADTELSQSIEIPDDIDYAVVVTITRSAGSYSLEFGNNEYLSAVGDSTTHEYIVSASTGTYSFKVIGDSDFVGDVSYVSARQLYYQETKFIEGSLQINAGSDTNVPNAVVTRYTEPSSSQPSWAQVLGEKITLPGAENEVLTTLYLDGVVSSVEANNKANNKLYRFVNPVTYTYKTTDHAVRFRKGSVIQLKESKHGVNALVRCMGVEYVGPGQYKVTGDRYSEDQYPSEVVLPSNNGTVPIGAIVPTNATVAPSGWAFYTDADGKFIIGAGDTYAVDDTGGSETYAGFSGNTSTDPAHSTGTSSFLTDEDYPTYTGNVSDIQAFYGSVSPDTDHNHSYSTGVITPDLLRREQRLMIKESVAVTKFPVEAQVFGLANVVAANVSRITTAAGRLLQAATAAANAGSSSKVVSLTTGNASVAHEHFQFLYNLAQYDTNDLYYPPPGQTYRGAISGLGVHPHTFNANLVRNPKKRAIPLYGGSAEFNVVPGMMVLWAGSLVSLPTDWVLCDGANNTYDLTNYFIEIAQLGEENNASGDNTIAISGNTSSVTHNHAGSSATTTRRKYSFKHDDNQSHNHSITDSDTWLPPYYALAMIMYAPT